ncbi:hypothetical protein GTN66_06700, partial [bacterium]|nr:hypothetical protein [bacterium]NIO21668.1 hypothetical protein [Candidatus Aenigmarchaeota archaeon]NIO74084.1 hypothetical protein [bacterium]
NRYHSATKGHKINIENAYLSMLAASTVETYQGIFDSNFLDIGFINRIFVVRDRGGRKWAIPPEMDRVEKDRLKRHLGELLRAINDSSKNELIKMPIQPRARELFEFWYQNEMADSIHAKRLDTYGLRLMALLGINEGKTEIDEEITKKVITILNWEYQIRKQVDPIDAEGQIARMEERIRRVVSERKEGIPNRDLKRAVHYNRYGLYIYNAALKNMLNYREMRYDHKTKVYFPR